MDRGLLVHATAIIPRAAPHGDLDWRVQPDRDGMGPARVQHFPLGCVGLHRLRLQRCVHLAQGLGGKVYGLHGYQWLQK